MTKFGHLESYMLRNKLLEMSISREKKEKEKERENKKEYISVNQGLHRDIFKSEDIKGSEAKRWSFFSVEEVLAEADM